MESLGIHPMLMLHLIPYKSDQSVGSLSQVPDCTGNIFSHVSVLHFPAGASLTALRPLVLPWNLPDLSRCSLSSLSSPPSPFPTPSLSSDSLETSSEASLVTVVRPDQVRPQEARGELEDVVEVTVQTISSEVRTSWSAGKLAATTSPRARARTSAGRTG